MNRAKRYGGAASPFRAVRVIQGKEYDWPATNRDMKILFGHDPNKHWPDEGFAPIEHQGRMVQVLAKQPGKRLMRRTLATCIYCGCWHCAGHLGQHEVACKQRDNG